ncbi:MAG: hypothetical protein V6Z82_04380 [Flavobacteriales bacterium]
MKLHLFLFGLLFCAIASPSFCELSDADLDKIRLIVIDAVNASEKRIKTEIATEIAKSEKSIKEYVDIKVDSVEKRLSIYQWGLGIFATLFIASMGIPQIITAWKSRSEGEQENKTNSEQDRINQELRAEIETLKQQNNKKQDTPSSVS